MAKDRKIVLENGREFYGKGFGGNVTSLCEIVFNTSMAGYQEIISDPSYTGQAIVMTYPLIGNYGLNDEDYESKVPTLGGLIVREHNESPSNFRSTKTISEVLEENNIPGISGIDTRCLTRIIRNEGSQKVLICPAEMNHEEAMTYIKNNDLDTKVVQKVSSKKRWYSRIAGPEFHVVAIDCGIKLNIVHKLNDFGCNVTVVPYNVTPEEIIALHPDGLFISNGPGNPMDVPEVIEVVKALRGKLPIFGICLGHQIISLAYGGKTFKLKFGHRGGNHPVMELATGKIEITSQNHSYAVDADSLKGTGLELTHINILDKTAEGAGSAKDKIFSVQYHPESAPGPQDSYHLFARFIDLMKKEAPVNA